MIFSAVFFGSRLEQLAMLAARHRVPRVTNFANLSQSRGLMSYGINRTNTHRQAGLMTGQILKGAKPADLPVVQSARFELVINLKTAKALGLQIPDKLLTLADEVLE